MQIIFQGRRKSGRLDLEAVEMALRLLQSRHRPCLVNRAKTVLVSEETMSKWK